MAAKRDRAGDRIPSAVRDLVTRSELDLYSEIFRALSEPIRAEIVRLIGAVGSSGDYPCTGLEEELPISKSTISYHVKILSKAGLVTVRRDGRNFRYHLNREVFDHFVPGYLDRLLAQPPTDEEGEAIA
jgi:DNA-binding transcriptional ArsR family regulator